LCRKLFGKKRLTKGFVILQCVRNVLQTLDIDFRSSQACQFSIVPQSRQRKLQSLGIVPHGQLDISWKYKYSKKTFGN